MAERRLRRREADGRHRHGCSVFSGPRATLKLTTNPSGRRVRLEGPFRMSNTRKRQVFAATLLFVFAWDYGSLAQSEPAAKTRAVMLGTGTPLPDPDRSGPSTA